MSFDINTNIASLQAQNYLRTNSDFQAKTINRVTSGLRIISSGDDAAGLAIANGFRSDQAVLTQGIRNANDGLSTLQTIDGGMNNISQLLDRARTLATQSASGTFTGDRNVLNNEFQSVMSEIDRQAQSIGLDRGGQFAKSLSVFIGGGKANNGTSAIQNGSVGVDLSTSTVDTQSLGLKGSPAANSSTYSLATASSTNVSTIVAANKGSNTSPTADFYFSGPGFSTEGKIKVSVNVAGLTTADQLANAINTQIANATNGGSASATAFGNAGITAQITTDASGNQKLAFSSSSAAFQVEAGNTMANAFMGNLDTTSGAATGAGVAVGTTVTGTGNLANGTTETVTLRFQGSSLAAPEDITFSIANTDTKQQIHDNLMTQIANDSKLAAAGITLVDHDFSTNAKLQFTSSSGEAFTVAATGDTANQLGFGTFVGGPSNAFDAQSFTGQNVTATAVTGAKYQALQFSINGAASGDNEVILTSDAKAFLDGKTVDLSKLSAGDTLTIKDDMGGAGSTYTLQAADLADSTLATLVANINTQLTTDTANFNVQPTIQAVGGRLQIVGGTAATGSLTFSASSSDVASALGFTNGQTATGTADTQTASQLAVQLNAAFQANSALKAAGLNASFDSTGHMVIASNNGTSFRMTDLNAIANTTLGTRTDLLNLGTTAPTSGVDYAGASATAISTTSSTFSSGGVNESSKFDFSAIL
ncbi:MAG: hypothetical protein M1436_00665, partial [Acidobacteria bacterium]|nr:hypothetical protein [Acidobacteriota bacterium]